jgi:hypothetical protein
MKDQLVRKPDKTIHVKGHSWRNGPAEASRVAGLTVTLSYPSNSHALLGFVVHGRNGGSRDFRLQLTLEGLEQLEGLLREGRQSLESVTPSASRGSEGARAHNESAAGSSAAA